MVKMIDGKTLLENTDYISSLQNTVSKKFPWKDLCGKTVLVAGAAGLLGSFLVDSLMYANKRYDLQMRIIALGRNIEKLKKRFSAYCDSNYFTIVSQNISISFSAELLKMKTDYIFHLASNTHPIDYSTKPIDTIIANILGTKNLLDLAVLHNSQRFIFASSVEIYGENRGDTEKFREDYCGYIDCNTVRAGYPEGKRAGEALCQAYIREKNLDVVIPRFCRVYGETMLMSDSKAISQFIKNALSKENIVLKSDGSQLYSYIYVADAVSALLYCLFYGKTGEAYNIADEKSDITLKELAAILATLSNAKVVFDIPNETERRGFSKATKAVLDSAKIRKLGWCADFAIKNGITHTLNILKESKAF